MLAREEAIRNNKSIHKVEKDLLDRLKVVYVDSKDFWGFNSAKWMFRIDKHTYSTSP